MSTVSFAWWNLGNLFPANAHPNWREWDQALFDSKLANLGQVIRALGPGDQGPDLLGVAEVADEGVLATLIDRHLADLGYRIVHHDSPDLRGIDVAFIYREAVIELHAGYTRAHTVIKRSPTRDILEIYLTVRENGARLAVLGNHWPARSAGTYESEPLRIMTAEQCGVIVDLMCAQSEGAIQLLVLGDFNDDPFDRSLQNYLLALRDREKVLNTRNRLPYLYNCSWRLLAEPEPGTFYFAGEGTPWFMFDQVLVSPGLLRPEGGLQLVEDSVAIFRPPWLRRHNGAPKPFAMVSGDLVQGYSDHFPIVGQLAAL